MDNQRGKPLLGIQLFTVRDLTDDENFKGTLRALAELGFRGVEFAWKYGGMNPDELADFLRSLGLKCCGMHLKLDELLDPGHLVYKYAEAVESPYVTISLAGRESEWDALLPKVKEAGRVAAEKGLTFTYHNHRQEFDGPAGENSFDRLAAETDPDYVKLELDIGWAAKAGFDPMEVWRRYADRTPQIHLRDYDAESDQICDIGEGFINADAVLEQARRAGTEWLIFEQDRYPVSPLESARVCVERIGGK